MLIELGEGFFVNPEDVAVVKATGEGKCALFTVGQSAVDGGFHIPYDAQEISQHVNDACEELYSDEEDDDTEDEAEE
jgi:hypothetical protein